MKNKSFKEWALNRLVDGAYEKMSLLSKINFWLESWCSHHYGFSIMCQSRNRVKSPSGLEWATYELPWYAKYISYWEFQFRNLQHKSELISGFFPFYYRNNK